MSGPLHVLCAVCLLSLQNQSTESWAYHFEDSPKQIPQVRVDERYPYVRHQFFNTMHRDRAPMFLILLQVSAFDTQCVQNKIHSRKTIHHTRVEPMQ